MRSLITLLTLAALLLPMEVDASSGAPSPRAQEGEGFSLLLAKSRRRRRKRRPRRRSRRKKKKAVKKVVKPVEKPEPEAKPAEPEKPVLPVAVLADLSIPADLQEQWAAPLAQGLVQGLVDAKEVSLLTGAPLKAKLGEAGTTTVVTEDALEALRQNAGAAVAYWIRLEPIKDRVRLTAVRTTAQVSIAFSRLLGPQTPEPAWFQQAAQALVRASQDQDFPAAPVVAVDEAAPNVAQEEATVRRVGPGSGLMIAGMGLLTAGFGMSLEEDAAKMEASDQSDDKSMQSSIADSRRVGERLVLGGYMLAGLGAVGALWSLAQSDGYVSRPKGLSR